MSEVGSGYDLFWLLSGQVGYCECMFVLKGKEEEVWIPGRIDQPWAGGKCK